MIILIVSIGVFMAVGISIPIANEMIKRINSKVLRNILRIGAASFIVGSIYMLPTMNTGAAVILLLTLSIISVSIIRVSKGFED